MNKQLLDKIEQALTAQQDTLQRQQTMLDEKDKDIAHLQNLLEQLAATQIEQLEHLPALYESLKNTINEQKKAYSSWITQRKEILELMNNLMRESIALCNAQIQLTERLKECQSTIALESSLSSDIEQLENELDDLASSQQRITNKQKKLEEQQQQLQKLLQQ